MEPWYYNGPSCPIPYKSRSAQNPRLATERDSPIQQHAARAYKMCSGPALSPPHALLLSPPSASCGAVERWTHTSCLSVANSDTTETSLPCCPAFHARDEAGAAFGTITRKNPSPQTTVGHHPGLDVGIPFPRPCLSLGPVVAPKYPKYQYYNQLQHLKGCSCLALWMFNMYHG